MNNPKTTTAYVVVNSNVIERATEMEQLLVNSYLRDLANAMREVENAQREIKAVLGKYCTENESVFYSIL